MNVTSVQTLEELKTLCSSCKSCPLHEGRCNVVFGEGSKKAKVMVIGEAPGKNEDFEGRPFIGKAGKLLDELLEVADLTRKEIYIANVIKCRPPNNRDPKADEVNNCSSYLRHQTKLINPKIIVTLGNFATKFILKTEVGITKLHGKPVKMGKFVVFPSFHPAACNYDKKKAELLHEDFKQLKNFVDEHYGKLSKELIGEIC